MEEKGNGSRVETGSGYAVVHGDKVSMQHVEFWAAGDSSQRLGRKDSGKRQSRGTVHRQNQRDAGG
jgi:hypothetical protein